MKNIPIRQTIFIFCTALMTLVLMSSSASAAPPAASILVASADVAASQSIRSNENCIHFDDLTNGTVYSVGSTFTSNGYVVDVSDFTWSVGTVYAGGSATVENGGAAAGAGFEMNTNNISLTVADAAFANGMEYKFGEYGGNINLSINGDFRNFDNYVNIDGWTIGGALVQVVNGLGNDTGTVRITGALSTVVIGGQEHYIDEICPLDDPQGEDTPDVGDAPDSDNHSGVAMSSYGSVTAQFPSVFDSAPRPSGPLHKNSPLKFFLGPNVSAEAEADQGADADGVNNIDPTADVADKDLMDDGVILPHKIDHCQPVQFEYHITNLDPTLNDEVYVNVWMDFNRSGRWGDTFDCPAAAVNEWAVQNHTVGLSGVGTFTFVTPAFMAHNPNPDAEMWMRVTVSEQPAPTSANAGYGVSGGYAYGETEDYLWMPAPDMPGIHGHKYEDVNGNGRWDDGEPGLEGWEIVLTSADGQHSLTTKTDINGEYWFDQTLPAGLYFVSEIQQPMWQQTAPASGYYEVQFDGSQEVVGLDFGNQQVPPSGGGIHGTKFADTNNNGQIDSDDTPLPGWKIMLVDQSGNMASTVTGDDGHYWFEDVPAGSYTISEEQQPGWIQVFPVDSAGAPTVYQISIVENQYIGGADFLNAPDDTPMPGIHGVKWHDENGDGLLNGSEPLIPNWGIDLYDENGNYIATERTNNDGFYWFVDLPPGNYYVIEQMQPFWQATYPPLISVPNFFDPMPAHFVTYDGTQDIHLIDFGNKMEEMPGIHGYKWEDINGNGRWDQGEPPLEGIQIQLFDDQGNGINLAYTDAQGAYWFADDAAGGVDLAAGIYYVVEMPDPFRGYIQTAPPSGYYKVEYNGDESIDNLNFGNHKPEMSGLHGRKWFDINGNGIMEPHLDEHGIEGWEITITDSTGMTRTTKTDERGFYWFTFLEAGDYVITEELRPNWEQVFPGVESGYAHQISYGPGQDIHGLDFLNTMPPMDGIHGYKWNDLNGDGEWQTYEPAIPGWMIMLKDTAGNIIEEMVTDEFGQYWFVEVSDGQTYIVEEWMQPGWMQTAPSTGIYQVTYAAGQAIHNLNFGNTDRPTSGIHGMKWHDINSNGMRDDGEPGLEGWTIVIEGVDGFQVTQVTNADGMYWFEDLPAGEYFIKEVMQSGWMQTFPQDGFHHIQYVAGQVIDHLDFGNSDEVMPGIHGMKWWDKNGNGEKDVEEPGLAGWPIKITSTAGQVVAELETDEQGHYWFVNAEAGTYIVEEGMLPRWEQTFPASPGNHIVSFDGTQVIEDVDFGNNRDGCGPMDVTFVLGTSGGMTPVVGEFQARASMLANVIKYLSSDDYQISLVSYTDDVSVDIPLSLNNDFAFISAAGGLFPGAGGAMPSANDEALNTAINSLPARSGQSGDFPNNWRAGALNLVILLNDTPPGGFDDVFDPAVDEPNFLARIPDANGNQMLVSAVQYHHDPIAAPLMDHLAMGTGGHYRQAGDPVTLMQHVREILEDCGGTKSGGIHGYKFEDRNGNGQWETTEPGLNGVEITLTDASGQIIASTTTDRYGEYWFMDVQPGSYTVSEIVPTGYIQTHPTSGVHAVTINGTETVHALNFGNKLENPGDICGIKYEDVNRNHDYDAGTDTLLSDWIILLMDNADGSVISTTTGTNGAYCFSNLPPGSYQIAESHHRSRTSPLDPNDPWSQSEPTIGTYAVTLGTTPLGTSYDFGNYRDGKEQFCHIYWDTHFTDQTTVDVQVEVYNFSNIPGKRYDVTMMGLPAGSPSPFGATSDQDGSTTFSFNGPGFAPVSVPANGGVGYVDVTIDYPPNMVMGGGWAFYQAIVTNIVDGESFGCIAALWPPDANGVEIDRPDDTPDDGVVQLDEGGTEVIEWIVENNGNSDLNVGIIVENMGPAGPATRSADGGVSINGQTPGTPYSTTVNISANMTKTVSVTVQINSRAGEEGVHDLLFNADTDGDGSADIVNSQTLQVGVTQATPTAVSLNAMSTERQMMVPMLIAALVVVSIYLIGRQRRRKAGIL